MDTSPSSFEKVPLLTPRQIEVLQLRAKEFQIDEIASMLVISEAAVKKHLHAIYEKLGISARHISIFDRLRVVKQYAEWLDQGFARRDEQPENADEDQTESLPVEAEIVLLWEEAELARRERFEIEPAVRPIPSPILIPGQPRRKNRPVFLGLSALLVTALLGGVLGGTVVAWLGNYAPQSIAGIIESQPLPAPIVTTITPPTIRPTDVVAATISTTTPLAETTEIAPYNSRCGEPAAQEFTLQPEFVRSQGGISYTKENSGGAVLSNFVRSLAVDARGLWIGYFPDTGTRESGLGFTDRTQWLSCNRTPGVTDQSVNDVLVDAEGNIWVATEQSGISRYDGEAWQSYRKADGLPSDATYGLAIDASGQIWAATWEGIAVFADGRWEVPYSLANNTIFNSHVHAIAFDASQNIWIGHHGAGVSLYENASGTWRHYTKNGESLSGEHIRDILVREATDEASESVWIATADGGISHFERGIWRGYSVEDGLPSNDVVSLAIDRYARIWAATAGGVVYFDGVDWQVYHSLPATAVAIGPSCEECPINDDMVWTATREHGLTYSRLPLDNNAIDILEVRYPNVVAPGETFQPEIVVAPRSPYQLREDRGDMLASIDADEFNRFGAWILMPVKGTVHAGEPFTFVDHDNPFVAPQLAEDETEKIFTSTWRVWMHTRFVGSPIEITFTVRKPGVSE